MNIPLQNVVVSQRSAESSEAYDVIASNIDVINRLFQQYLRGNEIAPDALRSYYVDYYLAEVNNGGFSQFVYNSRWHPAIVQAVREGLEAMKASQHQVLFEQGVRSIKNLGEENLTRFFQSDYFGDNAERDALNSIDDRFFEVEKSEALIELNAAWLKSLPHLTLLTEEQIEEFIQQRASSLVDREERIAAALANEPRYWKIIRAFCKNQGYELQTITAGDPAFSHNGTLAIAWHFLTNQGHFFMADFGDQALLFDGNTEQPIAELDVSHMPQE